MKFAKLLAIFLIISMSIGGVNAFAQLPDSQNWNYTGIVTPSFAFNNTQGTASLSVTGKKSATSISASIEVYKIVGNTEVYCGGNSTTVNSRVLLFSYTLTGESGCSYKAYFSITVYTDSDFESITPNPIQRSVP